ncbi:heterokaryon incompatibility protein-domain-containing protein [Neurospora crassa]|nr:heterokaryon incompatibility protein-domain-containing protein [Neurospora crassa]
MPPLSYYTIGEDQGEDELPPAILPLTEEGGNAIRLLTLREPSSHEGETLSLEMHLSTTSEKYIALSYEWGQAEPDDPMILVNNRQVQIRKNLHEALRQISEHYSFYRKQRHDFKCPHCHGSVVDACKRGNRPEKDCHEKSLGPWTNLGDSSFWAKHDPPRLWIDALCINQNDNKEKSSQVGRMGTIFSSAKVVLSWIGLPRDGSNDALRMMRTLSMSYPELPEFVATGGLTDSLIVSIASLCERTYWRRVWILQELYLAQKYVVMCGPESIASDSFDEALGQLLDLSLRPFLKSYNIMSRSAANAMVVSKRVSGLCSLVRWLIVVVNADFQATVPHDYIYAILAISSPGVIDMLKPGIDTTQIIVDYNKTAAEVYRQLLQSFEAGPSLMNHRRWLLKLALKMGLSQEEGVALLDSEHSKRCEVAKGSKSDLDN